MRQHDHQFKDKNKLAEKILNNDELFYILYILDDESFEEYLNSRSE